MARKCLLLLAAAGALLVLAPAAWADGTWGSKADYTNLHAHWADDAGNPVFYVVFNLTRPVQSATTADGRQCAVGQPDNNPAQVECPENRVSSGDVTIVTKEPVGCGDQIQEKVSENSKTYIPQRPITSRNTCTQPPCKAQGAQVQCVNNQPCDCAGVTAFLNDFGVYGAHTTRISFRVHAALTCTPGKGPGCRGRVKTLAPRGAKFVKPGHGKILDLNCAGPCNAVTKLHADLQYVAFVKKGKRSVPNPRFLPEGRAGKDFKIKLSLSCISPTGVPRAPRVVTMVVHFNKRGYVDYKHSDLNGDGNDDGRQLK
jgi:hypothetical protein